MSLEHTLPRLRPAMPAPVPAPIAPRPAAVHLRAALVPPLVLGGACMLVTAAAAWLAGSSILLAMALALGLPIGLHAVRCFLTGRIDAGHLGLALVIAGALFVIPTVIMLSVATLPPVVAIVAWASAVVAVEVGTRWRSRWAQLRPMRVTLLASSVPAARGAIARLEREAVLQVASILLPGADAEAVARELGRPVHVDPDEPMDLTGRVVVACPTRDSTVSAWVARLVARGQRIRSESDALRRAQGRVESTQANPIGLLHSVQLSPPVEIARRILASLAAALLLVVLAPLFVVIALAIVIETGFPVLYWQERTGYRGRIFRVVKFRTMRKDAESLSGPVFAEADDPRITRVGRVLRRYRLDELPQLWNVLRGEMALVGPRPERPHFFQQLRAEIPLFELRTCIRPGITGWAQVRMPYTADSDGARAKLDHDLFYLTHRSMLLDLAILFDTIGVALRADGSR